MKQQQIPPLHRELVKAVIAKVNPVGEIWWRPLELKTFQKWENFGRGSERIPITYAIVTATSKVKLFKSIGAVGYLNTWLPRSIFIYSNNTLLTAGCCKSELSYLKHWYRVLCPGLVKPILEHSWRRSWYMKLFHTPRTYFLLITRLWKHNSCSGVIFIPGKNLKALSRAFMNSFLHLSAHKSTTWNQNTYIKFHWLLLADRSDHIYLRSVTSWGIVCYPITSTSRFWMCHSISWMVLCQAFLSLLPLPPPPSKLSSPVAP